MRPTCSCRMRPAAVALILLAIPCVAEMIRPGVYHGYYAVDRWGQKVFHIGPYHLFLSDEAAAELKPHAGKPLKLDVREIFQPMNPGGAIIKKVGTITEGEATGLVLDLSAASKSAPAGKGIELRLVVSNRSANVIRTDTWSLASVLVTRRPFTKTPAGFRDPEGRAYWYYHDSVRDRGVPQRALEAACRETYLSFAPEEFAGQGKGARLGPRTPTHREPGFYYPLELDPDGQFEVKFTVGRELWPGEYEVFVYQTSGNFSHPAKSMSPRIPFDVVAPSAK